MKRILIHFLLLTGLFLVGLPGCRDNQGTVSPTKDAPAADAQARQAADNLRKFDAGIEDKSIADDYEIRDSVVHFKNPAVLRKALDNLTEFTASFKQRNADFVSVQSLTDQALEKSKSVSSKAEADAFLKEWGAYVREENETLMPRLTLSFNHLLNKDGFFIVGKRIYLFIDDEEFIILDGDKSKIAQIRGGKIDPNTTLRLTTKAGLAVSRSGRVASTSCRSLKGFRDTGNRRGQVFVDGRIVTIFYETDLVTGVDLAFTNASVVTQGYTTKKTLWWWDRYSTPNSLRTNYAARFEVNGVQVIPTNEPDFFTSNSATGIDSSVDLGNNTVPVNALFNNQVRILLDVRSGFYSSQGLSNVALFYNECVL